MNYSQITQIAITVEMIKSVSHESFGRILAKVKQAPHLVQDDKKTLNGVKLEINWEIPNKSYECDTYLGIIQTSKGHSLLKFIDYYLKIVFLLNFLGDQETTIDKDGEMDSEGLESLKILQTMSPQDSSDLIDSQELKLNKQSHLTDSLPVNSMLLDDKETNALLNKRNDISFLMKDSKEKEELNRQKSRPVDEDIFDNRKDIEQTENIPEIKNQECKNPFYSKESYITIKAHQLPPRNQILNLTDYPYLTLKSSMTDILLMKRRQLFYVYFVKIQNGKIEVLKTLEWYFYTMWPPHSEKPDIINIRFHECPIKFEPEILKYPPCNNSQMILRNSCSTKKWEIYELPEGMESFQNKVQIKLDKINSKC